VPVAHAVLILGLVHVALGALELAVIDLLVDAPMHRGLVRAAPAAEQEPAQGAEQRRDDE
jgi:hypothetical protein